MLRVTLNRTFFRVCIIFIFPGRDHGADLDVHGGLGDRREAHSRIGQRQSSAGIDGQVVADEKAVKTSRFDVYGNIHQPARIAEVIENW